MEHQTKPAFQNARAGYTYTFPYDHGAHEIFLTEWWYFTGHVFTPNNRRFGYELTFFRRAIDDERAWDNPSQWAIRQLYLAHFALTDEQNKNFRYAEKVSREALGKAGALKGRLHTWIDQWSVNAVDDRHQQFRLQAKADNFSIELLTHSSQSPVIHGLDGISQKGTRPTHASHYYSLTRLHTKGTLQLDGEEFTVTGTSWMDHEFASSELEDGLVGWDWFSLQLDSGHDIMTYWLRQEDGTFSPASSGTLIFPDGSTQHLNRENLTVTILDHWESPKSGARYPSQWTLAIQSPHIRLRITPRMNDQELRTDRSTQVTYWEGDVDTSGTFDQQPVKGMGYVELTGYDKND
ncbi:MAG: carotenoid 1,2-hydratase [Nitrospirales bacterium]|nr:MAG: carotenoid 1,2-hydratase [Nitrospirales bacterium]